MYSSTTTIAENADFRVYRPEDDTHSIWFRDRACTLVVSLTYAEAADLVAGLTRELAAVEAQVRGVSA